MKIHTTEPSKRIYTNSTGTTGKHYRYKPADHKGELNLHLSLPYVNSFYMKPQNEAYKVNTGIGGLSIGLDYYHSNHQFINLEISSVVDAPPLPFCFVGEHESMNSGYMSLSNNHKLGRFTVGYGLSYGRNTWKLSYYIINGLPPPPPPTRDPITKSHSAFGFIFPTYFQWREHFNIGIIYRPTFYRPTITNKFSYEHLISVDFAWKIRIKK